MTPPEPQGQVDTGALLAALSSAVDALRHLGLHDELVLIRSHIANFRASLDALPAPGLRPDRETVARMLADELGFSFDGQHYGKSEWVQTRGEKGGRSHDINEPFQADLLDAADAILALFPAEPTGWRPIETAPRNGRDVLLTTAGIGTSVLVGFWDEACGGVWSVWPGRAKIRPTHWQPLSTPPTGAA